MQPQQSTPFLQGDLTPRGSDFVDLRNDNAGTRAQQAQNIVLRYLQSLPAQDSADFDGMVQNITRHYPFQGEPSDFFRDAVKALEDAGLVKSDGKQLQLDKVANLARRYLLRAARAAR